MSADEAVLPGRPYARTALTDTVRFRYYKPTSSRATRPCSTVFCDERARPARRWSGPVLRGPLVPLELHCRWHRYSSTKRTGFRRPSRRRSTSARLPAPSAPNAPTSQPRWPTRPASTCRPVGPGNQPRHETARDLGPHTATAPTTAARPKPRPEVQKASQIGRTPTPDRQPRSSKVVGGRLRPGWWTRLKQPARARSLPPGADRAAHAAARLCSWQPVALTKSRAHPGFDE